MAGTDRSSIKTLITETITMLLQNSVQYGSELSIQGLLGVTIDKSDVFIIHIDQRFADIPQPIHSDLPSYPITDSALEIPSSHIGLRAKLPSMRRLVRTGSSGVRQRGGFIRSDIDNSHTTRHNEVGVAGHAAAVIVLPNKSGRNFEDNHTNIATCESLSINQDSIDKSSLQVARNVSGNTASNININADKCGFNRDSNIIDCDIESFSSEKTYEDHLHNKNRLDLKNNEQPFDQSQSMLQPQTHSKRFVEKQQQMSTLSNTAIDIPPNLQAIMQNAINQARFSVTQCTQPVEVLESRDLVKTESGDVSGCSVWNNAEELNDGYDQVSNCITTPYDAAGNVRSLIGSESMIHCNRKSTAGKTEATQWLTPEEIAMQSAEEPVLVSGSLGSGYQRTAGTMRPRNRAMSSGGVVHRRPALRGDPSDWRMVPVVTFSCPICNRSFRHKPSLYRHQIDAHGRAKKKRGWRRNSYDDQGLTQNIM